MSDVRRLNINGADYVLHSDYAELEIERDKYKAMSEVSICVWCKFVGKKDAETMAEHMLVCENHPVRALFETRNRLIEIFRKHSTPTPEGDMIPRDEIGMELVNLFPALNRFEEGYIPPSAKLSAPSDAEAVKLADAVESYGPPWPGTTDQGKYGEKVKCCGGEFSGSEWQHKPDCEWMAVLSALAAFREKRGRVS